MLKPRADVGRSPAAAGRRGRPSGRPTGPQGIGVDVVDVRRFTRLVALRGSAMCERVFTPRELADCHGSLPRLAARFAAKEATAKALGLGIGPIAWREVEVRTGVRGEPHLALTGAARRALRARGVNHYAVSLTHDATSAIAVVALAAEHGRGPRR